MKIIGGPYETVDDSQDEKTVRRIRTLIIILQLLWLPVWCLTAVLSIPGSGEKWQYWLMFAPLWAYPGLVIIAFAFSEMLLRRNLFRQVRTVVLLPPIISYGYPLGVGMLAGLAKEIIQVFA